MNDERFDELWSGLKDQITKAREARAAKDRGTNSATDAMFPGRVLVGTGSYGSSTVTITRDLFSCMGMSLDAEQLVAHAAHCLVAAEEIEADKIKRQTA